MQFLIPVTMEYTLKIKTKTSIKTVIVTALAAVVAVTAIAELAAPGAVQVIPSAYAQAGTVGSTTTGDVCSSGSFADTLGQLASAASSCGPNLSNSAAGDVAICMGDAGSISIGIKGPCSTSN